MTVYRYPQEVHDFVRENCTKWRDDILAEKCNEALGTEFTKEKMKAFRGNHGYNNGLGKLKRGELLARQTHYPDGMYEFVRDHSWHVSSPELVKMIKERFGYEMTVNQMKNYRRRYHFPAGGTGWFQKGRIPENKGKTIDEYMKPEVAAKVRQTAFKKGHRPHNEMPVGTVVVNAYSDGYKIRKKQMTGTQFEKWEFVHRAEWEKHHGPIPEGGCIVFLDGDRMNCNIENLALVTRGELREMNRNGYFSECPEATEAGLKLVRLKKKVNKIKKERKK